jgi:hypothetical protein
VNKSEWRQRACDEVNLDLADADDDVLDEIARDMATILDTVHERCPMAFVPDTETVFVYKDYRLADFGGCLGVSATADVRVLSFGVLTGTTPKTDGTWDGLFHIEVQDGAGRWHRRQCREFWSATNDNLNFTYYVSLDRPWPNTTDTNLVFRLYQPFLVTRADVTEVLDGQVWDATHTFLQTLPEGWVTYTDRNDFQGRSKGRPENLYRAKRFQLDTPTLAPAVTSNQVAPWLGPEPPGRFTYVRTIVWGRREDELVAPGGVLEPTFESAPSPVSSAITVPADGSSSVTVTLPDVDWPIHFGVSGALSATHSGLRQRIYRARATTSGSSGSFRLPIEYPNVYQLLAEVDGSARTYTDDGTVIPDPFRRLPETTGYYLWRIYPYPDQAYQIDLRVRRKPTKLVNDSDTPNIDPTMNEMLVVALMAKLYRMKGNLAEAGNCEQKFKDGTAAFNARFAAPAKVIPPIPWGADLASARRPFFIGPFRNV